MVIFLSLIFAFSTPVVINTTGVEELELAVVAGAEELGIQSKIYIVFTPEVLGNRNHVVRVWDGFYIYVDRTLRRDRMFRVLAHELIHIQQYESGRLIETDRDSIVIWEGRTYDMRQVKHEDRPWEIEAHRGDYRLSRVMIQGI